MTKKTAKPNVAKPATNEVKKATEQVKRPTLKSLQQEVANLTEQLVYANNLVLSLSEDLGEAKRYKNLFEIECSVVSQLRSHINDLENRSLWAEFWFRISKSFR